MSENPELRPRLEFHPLSNTFPMLPEDLLVEMAADIKESGQQEPIRIYQGKILDGRNRYKACLLAGVAPITIEYDGDDPVGFVISANLHRRHLTQAQKQEVVGKALAAHPELSDRAIAKLVRVDHKTVGAKRAELEARGEIPRVKTRSDTKGRLYPVRGKSALRRSSAGSAVGLAAAREPREADAVLAFAALLNERDINHHLNNLLRLLGGDVKKRITALPQLHRVALARGFLDLLEISADDLRAIVSAPVLEGAPAPGLPRDLPEDDDPNGDAESEAVIASAKPTDTLH